MFTTMHIRHFSACLLGLLLVSCADTSSPGASGSAAPAAPGPDYRNSRAEVVVLDFFDMYCHKCQTAASHVNDLHALARQRGYGSRIDFYAIGWGNTPMECEMYRKRFDVPFPVVSDRDRSISGRFGKFRPPLLVALRKEGGQWKEFYRVSDVRNKSEAILNAIQP